MSLTQTLREAAEPLWRQEQNHPFIQGLASGQLPEEKFRFYMCQDYAYLVEYCRVFALAAAKAGNLEAMAGFAGLLHATLNEEMVLHRQYAAEFGIAVSELEGTQLAPTAYAYSRHLLHVAYAGDLPEILAATLPCQWGYHEIGCKLSQVPNWQDSPYAAWIRTYASEEFGALAASIRQLLDELAHGLGDRQKACLQEIFMTSSRYEYLFWEMAYREEKWPI